MLPGHLPAAVAVETTVRGARGGDGREPQVPGMTGDIYKSQDRHIATAAAAPAIAAAAVAVTHGVLSCRVYVSRS